MANSKIPNFGTIFSRATGLLRSGGIKETPLWYDIYKKYPPDYEPCAERPVPSQDPIPEIVYEEDFDRVAQISEKEEIRKRKSPRTSLPHLVIQALDLGESKKEKVEEN